MSRLTELLSQVEKASPSLADDLRGEVKKLSARRPFGLNFERHVPELVHLPDRAVRRGDKVVIRDEHAELAGLHFVLGFEGRGKKRKARLVPRGQKDPEVVSRAVVDLVVVAEFRDPIYPGLRRCGGVERDPGKPCHVVVNGENYHVLEALTFVQQGTVDCIYIDPPYNTRDKDWKYNNDYVDSDDAYRHSKWLAMMERRLKLARRLLKPEQSVLIATIDEREYLRLGLLLGQLFPEARIQMISDQINPANVARRGGFGRNDEYVFFVMLGSSAPQRVPLSREWVSSRGRTFTGSVRWDLLRRSGTNAQRADRPNLFYPILVDAEERWVKGVGEPLSKDADRADYEPPEGVQTVWPIRKDGSEGNWQLSPDALLGHVEQGRVRLGGDAAKGFVVYYIKGGEYEKVLRGDYPVLGKNPDGSLKLGDSDSTENLVLPGTQWRVAAHDSTQYGSRLLSKFIPGRHFPFPKSLYGVEDALRFFLNDKPDALVLDFFAGSGTTAHAVMRLNSADDGRRRSILVTNNEVSEAEAIALREEGHRPGDASWEKFGIFEYITRPRLEAAVTGRMPDGDPVSGKYQFRQTGLMSKGFEENVEFFNLTYEDPEDVRFGRGFEAVAPLLWMRAGCSGRRIEQVVRGFDIADAYGVLFDIDHAAAFVQGVRQTEQMNLVYIVTDDESQFQTVAAQLPSQVKSIRLYSAYLENFQITAGD